MSDIVFIGDELSAAGFRLAGATVHAPALDETVAVFEAARRDASLLLITTEIASRLPAAVRSQALAATRPLLLVVPDVRNRRQPPDVGHLVRAQLGIEA